MTKKEIEAILKDKMSDAPKTQPSNPSQLSQKHFTVE
jgi:hypothetical protein